MSETIDTLENRKKYLENLIDQILRRLKHAPEGSLRIIHCNGSIQYYRYNASGYSVYSDNSGNSGCSDNADNSNCLNKSKQKYLTKSDLAAARRLAQKTYDRRLLAAAKKELYVISRFLDTYPSVRPEHLYEDYSEERKLLLNPVIETEEMFLNSWKSVTYTGKPFPEDMPELLTEKDEKVRSKSELLIANMLEKENVPYRYEYPVLLKGFGTVYPDFTVLNVRLRKEYYWEHQGMMDNPEYADKAIRKIETYAGCGIFPGDGLILSWETKEYPINLKNIKALIHHYLL